MTRPNILRADTLDLQDHENPSAAEHSKHPTPTTSGNAPNVAAQVSHVLEERHSEELALVDAWNNSSQAADTTTAEQGQNAQQHETNGSTYGGDDHGEGAESETERDDDMMDRISSSPSIDDEDIDFEFVYALHTFVATVEGQANATKGDTMVLLDDSNSYWWLVRVVKDSSIGYLPAEHIETPTERLARLNKHRNIDLSATMLSDNSEKSRNPLKKAMRRRNAKTVQFAAPTYVEASDYDYSSEDEDEMITDPYGSAQQADNHTQDEPELEREEPRVESKEPHAEGRTSTSSQRASFDREQAATAAQALAAAGVNGDDPIAPHMLDKTEAAPLKSKKRTNTDSFLKDDSMETRKITLTPGILRDESIASKSPDSSQKSSFESLAKLVVPVEPPRKESKEKKKEPKKGMLSGLFKSKKKDKKSKDDPNDADSEKVSSETGRDSPRASPLPSGKASPVEKTDSPQQNASPVKGNLQQTPSAEELSDPPQDAAKEFVAELPGSEVAHEMATGVEEQDTDVLPPQLDNEVVQQEKTKSSNPLSPITTPITNMLNLGDGHDKPKKAKRSKQRVELDDFDSPQEEVGKDPFADAQEEEEERNGERLSESPVEIPSHAFMHGTDTIHIPMPGQFIDDDDEEDEPGSLISSPSIVEHPTEPFDDEGELAEDNDPTPTARSPQPADGRPIVSTPNRNQSTDSTPTTASSPQHLSPRRSPLVSQQAWSDDALRAWLEDGSEVRDMLVMIHDTTGVRPAPADHPLMSGLFVEQRKGVQDMMGQLDGLLGSYLQRKGVRF